MESWGFGTQLGIGVDFWHCGLGCSSVSAVVVAAVASHVVVIIISNLIIVNIYYVDYCCYY